CPESVPAPTYQVGDRFTWKYTDGKERVWEVTGLDGNLAQVRWSDGDSRWTSENEGTYFLDHDWVIRKGINKKGVAVLSPGLGAFAMMGKKLLDFPLHMGKAWSLTYAAIGPWGSPMTYVSSLNVVGCEEVVTLAGKFLSLKIENRLAVGGYTNWALTHLWYSPDAKNIVKIEVVEPFRMVMSPSTGVVIVPIAAYELTRLDLK
ncbi:MAG TPA: hypothetical protein VN203_06895, partial [Candidatus Acidoferrum sp.]|nr:hypothetical protein [Candidatus Acidoferrum sp.]